MHSHIQTIGPNLLNTYAPRVLERTEATQRAAEVRKKLLGATAEVEVEADDTMDWLVGPGYQGGSRGGSGHKARSGAGDPQAEEPDHFVEAISVWA